MQFLMKNFKYLHKNKPQGRLIDYLQSLSFKTKYMTDITLFHNLMFLIQRIDKFLINEMFFNSYRD